MLKSKRLLMTAVAGLTLAFGFVTTKNVYADKINSPANATERYEDGYWYLNDNSTGKHYTGWQKVNGQTVYYNSEGQKLFGSQKVNGKWYYFDPESGARNESELTTVNGKTYSFDDNGVRHSMSELTKLVKSLKTNASVAIQSQKTGKIYSYNKTKVQLRTASTMKVSVLAQLLHQTKGKLNKTQNSLATRMIENSDNAATSAILDRYLGGHTGVKKIYKALGMNSTQAIQAWGYTPSTPVDQLKVLYQIFLTNKSSYLNSTSQKKIKYLMSHVNSSQRWGISAGSSKYYLKNGWTTYGVSFTNDPWYVDSIGFIPQGKNNGYTIAIYTYGDNYNNGVKKVEKIARKVKKMM